MDTIRFNRLQLRFERLSQLAVSITSESNLDKLLELILKAGVELTESDAGSVYLREKDQLFFRIALNKTLSQRVKRSLTTRFGRTVSVNISESSLAGFVAKNIKPLNIADAYQIPPEMPYRHNRDFDKASHYECHSMLLFPMVNHREEVVGVIQLINGHFNSETNEWKPYNTDDEKIIHSLSSLAAAAVTKSMLISEIYETYKLVMTRMALAVEQREGDPDTFVHIYRIAEYASQVAEELGYDETFRKYLEDAAPMHDIGKQCIPDAVLFKPGKLTDEEFTVIKRHPLYGCELFRDMDEPIAKFAYNITRYHHEKFNGKGYPDGISGEQIPIEARIIAVVDVFDALATDRIYKKAMPVEKCLEILRKDSGTHFDPSVVVAFEKRLEQILEIRDKFETVKQSRVQGG